MSQTEHPLAPMLRKLMRWSVFDDRDREVVLSLPFQFRKMERGDHIVRDGDTPAQSCVLLSGLAYGHKIVGNGGRQILSLNMSGDIVDFQGPLLGTADHNVQALTDVSVALISIEAMNRVAFSHPTVGTAMWRGILVDASIQREWTANIGRRDARTRTAHLLCEFGVRLQDAGLGSLHAYTLPMTREELADALGLTADHANRTLKQFEKERLIERAGRAITIIGWEKLRVVGDFEPAYLHILDKRVP